MISAKNELIRRLTELLPDCQSEITDIVNKFNIGFNLGQNHLELQLRINAFLYAKRVDGCSPKTLKDYAKTLRLFKTFKNKPVEEISTDDIREYICNLQDRNQLSKSTIQTYLATLRSFFTWCVIEEIITKNPMNKIKSIKVDKISAARKPLTAEEMEIVRDSCRTTEESALIEFLVTSGCRLSEVSNIKLSDIDWNNKSVTVTGKGDKTRVTFFSSHAKFIMQKYLKERKGQNSEYLFCSNVKPYGQLLPDTIYHIVLGISKNTGLQRRIFPHLMRHTFATNALHTGMDVTVVQSMLGHSDPKTTLIYAKLNPERIQMEYNMHMNLI